MTSSYPLSLLYDKRLGFFILSSVVFNKKGGLFFDLIQSNDSLCSVVADREGEVKIHKKFVIWAD